MLEEKVLKFLIENPEANPREIADSIGESLQRVRIALYRLRDRGYVMRGPRGYVVVKSRLGDKLRQKLEVEVKPSTEEKVELKPTTPTILTFAEVKPKEEEIKEQIKLEDYVKKSEFEERIRSLEEKVKELSSRIESLESKLNELSKTLKIATLRGMERKVNKEVDEVLILLKDRKVLSIPEIKEYIRNKNPSKSLEDYIKENKVKVIANLVVDKEFYREFINKMPIPVSKVKGLSQEEKALLRALIEEGLAYLHAAKEYRFIGEEY